MCTWCAELMPATSASALATASASSPAGVDSSSTPTVSRSSRRPPNSTSTEVRIETAGSDPGCIEEVDRGSRAHDTEQTEGIRDEVPERCSHIEFVPPGSLSIRALPPSTTSPITPMTASGAALSVQDSEKRQTASTATHPVSGDQDGAVEQCSENLGACEAVRFGGRWEGVLRAPGRSSAMTSATTSLACWNESTKPVASGPITRPTTIWTAAPPRFAPTWRTRRSIGPTTRVKCVWPCPLWSLVMGPPWCRHRSSRSRSGSARDRQGSASRRASRRVRGC